MWLLFVGNVLRVGGCFVGRHLGKRGNHSRKEEDVSSAGNEDGEAALRYAAQWSIFCSVQLTRARLSALRLWLLSSR